MRRHSLAFICSWVLLSVGVACTPQAPEGSQGTEERFSVASILGADPEEGYARVEGVRPFNFPQDHGPHSDHQIEWWYTTGNLRTAAGRHFGFELSLFRVRLRPPNADPLGETRVGETLQSSDLQQGDRIEKSTSPRTP